MENTPALLVPGFFLFVLIRQNNKKLTNSDGIRFIVSIFLASFILLCASYYITKLLESYFLLNLIIIPSKISIDLGKIIKDVDVHIYLNSFLVAFVWFAFSRLDVQMILNLIFRKSFFEKFLKSMIEIKEKKGKGISKLPWFRLILLTVVIILEKILIKHVRKFLNYISGILFLADESVHCIELGKLVKKLVLVTLSNEKVYIGRVESADINIIANTDDIVKLVPIFSGFRDGDKKVHITTEYELEPENASMETSILIFKREITTISNFDKKIAQQFIEKNMLIISK